MPSCLGLLLLFLMEVMPQFAFSNIFSTYFKVFVRLEGIWFQILHFVGKLLLWFSLWTTFFIISIIFHWVIAWADKLTSAYFPHPYTRRALSKPLASSIEPDWIPCPAQNISDKFPRGEAVSGCHSYVLTHRRKEMRFRHAYSCGLTMRDTSSLLCI